MIIDCPACGAGLMFDPETGKMKCEACGSLFEPYELEEDFQKRGEKEMQRDFAKRDGASGGLKLSGSGSTGSDGINATGNFEGSGGLKPAGGSSASVGLNTAGDSGSSGGLKLAGGAASGVAGAAFSAGSDNNFQGRTSDSSASSDNTFNPYSDFDHPVYDHTDNYNQADYNETEDSDDTMECNIYTCTSCGAEVAINNVEASTFCSFCGQPTVVFNRVASQKKPKYIIPFSVTQDRAISLIRERLNKGFYVPEEIKNFEIERVRGIYIPFWLYDIYYHDSQYLKGTVGSGKNSHTYYYFREAECDFNMLTLDASKQLNDETSQRLEPYRTEYIKDFSLEYLSGFYADTYDVKTSQLDGLALTRARTLFNKEVEKTINAHSISILKNNPEFRIKNTHYAMFPAWFLTFRYENIPYTLLVNGQTEKIIGGVPYDRAKVSSSFAVLAVVLTVIATIAANILLMSGDEEAGKTILAILILSGACLFVGISNLKKVKESTELTSLSTTNKFVRDRGQQ